MPSTPAPAPQIRCLLVDDDPAIRELLVDYLLPFGMQVETVPDAAGLRRRLPDGGVDVLLLDLMLPDENGLQLCPWAKAVQPGMPVIMLTAQGDTPSRVVGLELGADDYLAKPFEPRELVARIRAVLRWAGAPPATAASPQLRFQGWTFHRIQRQLTASDGTVVALSAAEFRLLSAFVDHPGVVLGRERLLQLTRAPGVQVNERSIDLAVSRLRVKLHDEGAGLIRTLRGTGYLFSARVSA
ncbi:MAG: response regulator transcription factor [Burkholderiaceae bacterium]